MRHSNNLVVGRILNDLQTAIKGESRHMYTHVACICLTYIRIVHIYMLKLVIELMNEKAVNKQI